MMNIYNNPNTAPNVPECRGDSYCNGFIALSKQWKDIPDSYRYEGDHDIKYYAKRGWTYDDQGRNRGLSMGFVGLQIDQIVLQKVQSTILIIGGIFLTTMKGGWQYCYIQKIKMDGQNNSLNNKKYRNINE